MTIGCPRVFISASGGSESFIRLQKDVIDETHAAEAGGADDQRSGTWCDLGEGVRVDDRQVVELALADAGSRASRAR